MNRAEEARWRRQVQVDPSGCWLWTGPLSRNGYPRHRAAPGKPLEMAHRLSYETFVGPIPDGMFLDHRCHTEAVERGECTAQTCPHRRCVRPEHLEVVTAAENTRRQDHAKRRTTHCPAGHEYTPENTTLTSEGWRRCRRCDAERVR